MQHEIKTRHPLLDKHGKLIEPGYTKGLMMDYDRKAIKGGALRIKEWDYYCIACDDYAVCLTIADNSYMGMDSITLIEFGDNPWEQTTSPMCAFTMGKRNLPADSSSGDIKVSGKGYHMEFEHFGTYRLLTFHMDNFKDGKPIDGHIRLENPKQENMVIVTPFAEKETAFYYNQKINCMPATGSATFNGKVYEFKEGEAFGVLDWGRGVWTYKNTWYWGSASGKVGDVPFGWNIGYGFGDTSAASENMLFHNGKAHKLSQVTFNIPMKDDGKGGQTEDYMKPWTFTSDDGRFEMDFVPIINRSSYTDVKIITSDQNQVFGKYTGKAVLDDGTVVEVKDFLGFAEKVYNKW